MELLPSVSSMKGPCNGVILDSPHFAPYFGWGLRSYNLRRRWIVLLRHPRFFAMSSKEMKWKSSNQCRLGVWKMWGIPELTSLQIMNWCLQKKGPGPSPSQKMVADSKLIFCPQNLTKITFQGSFFNVEEEGKWFCGLWSPNWDGSRKALTLTGQMWIPEFTGWCILMSSLFLSLRAGFFHRDFSIWQRLEPRVTIEPLAKLMYQVIQSDLFIP